MTLTNPALAALRKHVTGAIEAGKAEAIVCQPVCENEGTVSREGIYTKLVAIDCRNGASFVALIKPDTDLDDTFKCFDIDNNEWLRVRGWACEVSDYNEGA